MLLLSVAILGQSATAHASPVASVVRTASTMTYPYSPAETRSWYNASHHEKISGSDSFYLAAFLNRIVVQRVLAYLVAVDRAKSQTCNSPSSCADLTRRAFSIYAPAFASGAPNVMYCESGGNPRASNGGRFLGLLQQMASAWSGRAAAYGMGGRSAFDPWANAVVSAHMVQGDGGWQQWECKP